MSDDNIKPIKINPSLEHPKSTDGKEETSAPTVLGSIYDADNQPQPQKTTKNGAKDGSIMPEHTETSDDNLGLSIHPPKLNPVHKEEFNRRKVELALIQKCFQNYLNRKLREADKKTLDFMSKYISGRSYEETNADLAERKEYITQHKLMFEYMRELSSKIEFMPSADYSKAIELMTGYLTSEFRARMRVHQFTEFNPARVADLMVAQKVTPENSHNALTNLRERTQENLRNMPDNGAIKQLLNDTIISFFGGTTTDDLDQKSNEIIQQLYALSSAQNSPLEFVQKYRELTGVTFSPEKIQNAIKAKEKFVKIQALQSNLELLSDKNLQNILKNYEKNPEIITSTDGWLCQDAVTPMVNASISTTAKLMGLSNDEAKKLLKHSFEKAIGKKFSEASKEEQREFFYQHLKNITSNEKINELKNALKELGAENFQIAEFEYKTAIEEAFGKNELAEMIESNKKWTEYSYQGVKIVAIIGASIITGGVAGAAGLTGLATSSTIAAASGGTSFALDLMEKSTDSSGLTVDEFNESLKDASTTAAFTFLGATANQIGSNVLKHSEKLRKIATSQHALPKASTPLTKAYSDALAKSPNWITKVLGEGSEFALDVGSSYAASKIIFGDTSLGQEAVESGAAQVTGIFLQHLAGRFGNKTNIYFTPQGDSSIKPKSVFDKTQAGNSGSKLNATENAKPADTTKNIPRASNTAHVTAPSRNPALKFDDSSLNIRKLMGLSSRKDMTVAELRIEVERLHTELCDELGIPKELRAKINFTGKLQGLQREEVISKLRQSFGNFISNYNAGNSIPIITQAEQIFGKLFDSKINLESLSDTELAEKIAEVTKDVPQIQNFFEQYRIKHNVKLSNAEIVKKEIVDTFNKELKLSSYDGATNQIKLCANAPDILTALSHETYHEHIRYILSSNFSQNEIQGKLKDLLIQKIQNNELPEIHTKNLDVETPDELPTNYTEWLKTKLGKTSRETISNLFEKIRPIEYLTETIDAFRLNRKFIKNLEDLLKIVDSNTKQELKKILENLKMYNNINGATQNVLTKEFYDENACLTQINTHTEALPMYYSNLKNLNEILTNLSKNNNITSNPENRKCLEELLTLTTKSEEEIDDFVFEIAGLYKEYWHLNAEEKEIIEDFVKFIQENPDMEPTSKRNHMSREKALLDKIYHPVDSNPIDILKYTLAVEDRYLAILEKYHSPAQPRTKTPTKRTQAEEMLHNILETHDANTSLTDNTRAHKLNPEEIAAGKFATNIKARRAKEILQGLKIDETNLFARRYKKALEALRDGTFNHQDFPEFLIKNKDIRVADPENSHDIESILYTINNDDLALKLMEIQTGIYKNIDDNNCQNIMNYLGKPNGASDIDSIRSLMNIVDRFRGANCPNEEKFFEILENLPQNVSEVALEYLDNNPQINSFKDAIDAINNAQTTANTLSALRTIDIDNAKNLPKDLLALVEQMHVAQIETKIKKASHDLEKITLICQKHILKNNPAELEKELSPILEYALETIKAPTSTGAKTIAESTKTLIEELLVFYKNNDIKHSQLFEILNSIKSHNQPTSYKNFLDAISIAKHLKKQTYSSHLVQAQPLNKNRKALRPNSSTEDVAPLGDTAEILGNGLYKKGNEIIKIPQEQLQAFLAEIKSGKYVEQANETGIKILDLTKPFIPRQAREHYFELKIGITKKGTSTARLIGKCINDPNNPNKKIIQFTHYAPIGYHENELKRLHLPVEEYPLYPLY